MSSEIPQILSPLFVSFRSHVDQCGVDFIQAILASSNVDMCSVRHDKKVIGEWVKKAGKEERENLKRELDILWTKKN